MAGGPIRVAIVALLLAGSIVLAFGGVTDNGWITYDDPAYVTGNPVVREGLSPAGVAWAFTTFEAGNWHPLTWLSHLLDVTLFGLDPGRHHAVSLLLHLVSAVFFFLLLLALTGRRWASLGGAAITALHPLRVESVAWASERKDVLVILLSVSVMLAWVRYVRSARGHDPISGSSEIGIVSFGMRGHDPNSGVSEMGIVSPRTVSTAHFAESSKYLLALGLYVLALMAKPTAVALPLLLLVMDGWPLGRWRRGGPGMRALLLEKIPFLFLAAGAGVVTLLAQRAAGAVALMEPVHGALRMTNAAVAVLRYLGKTIWPAGLSVFYPYPARGFSPWAAPLAIAALVALTGFVAWRGRRQPWLGAGWCWFVVALLPALGLVQVGSQGMADRYTSLPHLGLGLAVAGFLGSVPPGAARRWTVAATVAAVVALAWVAYVQTGYWRDTRTLFGHALEVDPGNWLASAKVGSILLREGNAAGAVERLRVTVDQKPYYLDARINLAIALAVGGRRDEARRELEEARRQAPASAAVQHNLGRLAELEGNREEAVAFFRRATELDPEMGEAREALERVEGGP